MYDRKFNGRELTFGVSGKLWNANVLLYDRQSESLWSQVRGGAVTGPMTGTRFKSYPSAVTTWKRWRIKHPDTLVLSPDTGYRRDYSKDPYDSYYRQRGAGVWRLFTPAPGEEEKRLVAGVNVGSDAKAFPINLLKELGTVTDKVGSSQVTLTYEAETGTLSASLKGPEGKKEFAPVVLYLFVWKAANPGTELYENPAP